MDYLRGVAAVMVCLCHFRYVWPVGLAEWFKLGEVGVQLFFVISGCVIPWSMIRGGYRISDIGRFWVKRIIRLQPALMVAIILTFVLSYAAGVAKGEAGAWDFWSLTKSMFYLEIPAENPVIWTLIVELKYYLFVSVLFPWLFSPVIWVRRLTFFLVLGATFALSSEFPLARYTPYFFLGFVACYNKTCAPSWKETLAMLMPVILFMLIYSSVWELSAACIAYLGLVYGPRINWPVGAFLGSISYSLYLIHFPVGVKLLNLTLPHLREAFRPAMLPVVLAVCIGLAWLMYRWIEAPSHRIASRIPLSRSNVKNI